jgi:hypothetical protein
MFNRPLRLAHAPDANGADRNAEPCVARRAAIGAAEAFWLALIAAVVAWVVSPSANSSRCDRRFPGLSVRGKGRRDL